MEKVKQKLTHRQRQALATQKLIADTARKMFLEQGYGATTIEAISVRAGVAVSTVYAIFTNKRGILRAIREEWHLASGQRDIYKEALTYSDPARRLEVAAHATRRQWETSAAMMTIYLSAAATDQEAAAELKQALEGRKAFLSYFISELSTALRSDIDPARATAIFQALTKPEIYQELVQEAKWSPVEYETWLADILKQQLLP